MPLFGRLFVLNRKLPINVLTINQIRKTDPEITSKLTDEEIEAIRDSFYEFGQLIFDDWYMQKYGSKNPIGSLTSEEDKHTI